MLELGQWLQKWKWCCWILMRQLKQFRMLMYLRLLCQHCLTLHIWRWVTGLGRFPKINGNENREGNWVSCADPLHASLTCFWQNGTSWERMAGDEEAMQATQCYQRLHVFSLENQNLFQSPHSAAETMCVLNKRNEWNRWALPLVMSALGALDGRQFQKLSPVLLCFVWFCFNLIWNIVEGNYQARPLQWLSVNQGTYLKVILNPST